MGLHSTKTTISPTLSCSPWRWVAGKKLCVLPTSLACWWLKYKLMYYVIQSHYHTITEATRYEALPKRNNIFSMGNVCYLMSYPYHLTHVERTDSPFNCTTLISTCNKSVSLKTEGRIYVVLYTGAWTGGMLTSSSLPRSWSSTTPWILFLLLLYRVHEAKKPSAFVTKLPVAIMYAEISPFKLLMCTYKTMIFQVWKADIH